MLINFNGDQVDGNANHLNHSNRAFRYGDGIFEAMIMFRGKVDLLHLHGARLQEGARILELNMPEKLLAQNIENEIYNLCHANNLTNARIRIFLFRKSEGNYAPVSNEASFIIEAETIPNDHYLWNEEGLKMGVYKEILKPINIFSNIKTCNSLLYVKAGIFKNNSNLDECIILNDQNQICESISCNIFWIKNNKIYTPNKDSGCIMGVMRNYLVQYFTANQIEIEEGNFVLENILKADEVFLSGATRGINWVKELNVNGNTIVYNNAINQKLFERLFHLQ